MGHAIDILAVDQSTMDSGVKALVGIVIAAFWLMSQVLGSKTRKPDRRLPPAPMPPGPLPQAPPTLPGRLRKPSPASRTMPTRNVGTGRANVGRRGGPMYERPPAMPARSAPLPTRAVTAPPVQRRPDLTPEYHGIAAPISRSLRDTSDGKKAAAPTTGPLPRGEFIAALLQPRNLRKAYILNEILQPPVSMRGEASGPLSRKPMAEA